MKVNTKDEDKCKLKKIILDKTGVDIEERCCKTHYFTKEFDRIFSQDAYPQYKDRRLYFYYFLIQLEKIKNHSQKDFRNYLSKLAKDGTNLVGEKFEILT